LGTNRLKACDSQLHPPTGGPRIRFDSAHSHSPLGEPADHCLLSPIHYEKNYAYPLVVWLHGEGGDERQLHRIMPLVSLRNYIAAAPRGTISLSNEPGSFGSEPGEAGFGWGDTEDQILLAQQHVSDCITDACQHYHVHAQRIFLAGFGAGGTMAMRLALGQPQHFAGAISLLGPFPQGNSPLRFINHARQLPLLLATASQGDWYPQQQVCDDLRLFHSAGMSVSLRQYPCDDQLTTHMLSDMDRWIMEQVCPDTAVADSPEEHPRQIWN